MGRGARARADQPCDRARPKAWPGNWRHSAWHSPRFATACWAPRRKPKMRCIRAVRSFEAFQGQAALRSWLYRIATNVCLSKLEARRRRPPVQPLDLGACASGAALPGEELARREHLRLALATLLRVLPPRPRAVFILRDVFQWSASEVAERLDTSVPAVNSALQRARARLAAVRAGAAEPSQGEPEDPALRLLSSRYLEAFERVDVDALTPGLTPGTGRPMCCGQP
jgi:RNA polymerase sigma-70 factor, ECF subfamily